ncbi:LPD25 domain-containing protein [Lachnospiraceae bacterium 48-21]
MSNVNKEKKNDVRLEIEAVDRQNGQEKKEICMEAGELAKKINEFQKRLDPDSYFLLYPDSSVHEKKITMQILTETGRKKYVEWLSDSNFEQLPGVKEEAKEIRDLLENAEIQWPDTLPPIVYISFSEDLGLKSGDVLSLEDAESLFGRLDWKQKQSGEVGYNKTDFIIYYKMSGSLFCYEGRQDLGDGEGSLLGHIEAFADYYLNTEGGKQAIENMGDSLAFRENCEYIRDKLLTFLYSHCLLANIEHVLNDEKKMQRDVPVVTERQEVRREYHRDFIQYIQECRRALAQGGTLPKIPDIKDYEETIENHAYREQLMKEMETEIKQQGLALETYEKNGYEPKMKKR